MTKALLAIFALIAFTVALMIYFMTLVDSGPDEKRAYYEFLVMCCFGALILEVVAGLCTGAVSVVFWFIGDSD